MRSGKFRHRLTIQQVTETRGATGEIERSWSTFAERWGAMTPLAGREYFMSAQRNAEVTHRFELRFTPGVTAKMRVLHDGRTFNIEGVIDVEERHREMHLMCEEMIGEEAT